MGLLLTAISSFHVDGQTGAAKAQPVTVDNFVRAESDRYLGGILKDSNGALFNHRRDVAAIDNQTVIHLNRDTLYSSAVFDLDAGAARWKPDRWVVRQLLGLDPAKFELWVLYGVGSDRMT